jgi:hypothetical protein
VDIVVRSEARAGAYNRVTDLAPTSETRVRRLDSPVFLLLRFRDAWHDGRVQHIPDASGEVTDTWFKDVSSANYYTQSVCLQGDGTPLLRRRASCPPSLSTLAHIAQNRFHTWRKLWLELARAEKELGLPIPDDALAQMEANLHLTPEQFAVAAAEEKIRRHDVMAHVHTFGTVAPAAAGIIQCAAHRRHSPDPFTDPVPASARRRAT